MASAVIGSLRVNLGVDTAAFGDGLKQAGGKLGGFSSVVKKAAAVAIAAFSVVKIKQIGQSWIDAADEMNAAAQRFGVPIETLSRLKYAAELSNVSFEDLGTGLKRLSQNMAAAAANPASSLAKIFADIGVSVADAEGNVRPVVEVLGDVAKVMAAMPEGAAKIKLATDLGGKSFNELIPLINGGKEALQGMMAEADKFGQVFSAETGASADQFNDNMDRLRGAFANIAGDLTVKLLPYLTQLTNWLVENGPRLEAVVIGFVKLGATIVDVGGKIIAAVASFDQWGKDTASAIRQALADIESMLAGLRDQFLQIGYDIVEGIKTGIQAKWQEFLDWIQVQIAKIPKVVRDFLGIGSPSKVFAEIGRNIVAGLSVGIQDEAPGVTSALQEVGQTGVGHFQRFVEFIVEGSGSAGDALRSLADDLRSLLLNQAFNSIFGGLSQATGLGWLQPRARGGPVTAGRPYIVGEHGPEMFMPRSSGQIVPNGGGVQVIVNNNSGANASVQESRGPGGMRQIEVLIEGTVDRALSHGRFDRTMRSNFGVGRRPQGA